jgi:hypothetical protein
MTEPRLSEVVKGRIQTAAQSLGASSPVGYVGRLLDDTFALPPGHPAYANNYLAPRAVPFESSFSEQEPGVLRFTIEPLGPRSSPGSRRDESTREMRRLVGSIFGHDALRWFDEHSEEWRGMNGFSRLRFGAWFGAGTDHDGLHSSKVYYELLPGQLEALPPALAGIARVAMETLPQLTPLFTTIVCRRHIGNQRLTFGHRGPLQLTDLQPLMQRLGLAHQLPSLMQVVGLALGGRFDLPENGVLLGLADTPDGPELKLEILLGMLPDLPPSFLNLLALGLAERPRHLSALKGWIEAFTPPSDDTPGDFSVMSVRVTPVLPARVSLYLRPVELDLDYPLQADERRGGL